MDKGTTIVVQVQPDASSNKVARLEGGVWHLKITAPPVKGKANRELIGFLSDILGVSKSSLTVEKGLTSKRKVIAIEGLTEEEVRGAGEEASFLKRVGSAASQA